MCRPKHRPSGFARSYPVKRGTMMHFVVLGIAYVVRSAGFHRSPLCVARASTANVLAAVLFAAFIPGTEVRAQTIFDLGILSESSSTFLRGTMSERYEDHFFRFRLPSPGTIYLRTVGFRGHGVNPSFSMQSVRAKLCRDISNCPFGPGHTASPIIGDPGLIPWEFSATQYQNEYYFRVQHNPTVTTEHDPFGTYGTYQFELFFVASSIVQHGVLIQPTSRVVTEGRTSYYDVRLRSVPPGTVTVTPSSDNPDVTVSPSSLTILRNRWAEAHRVTVAVRRDADAEDEVATISHAVSGYHDVTEASQAVVTVRDSERAAAPSFGSATVSAGEHVAGEAIAELTLPAATGGNAPVSYSLSPALPAGLVFDPATRTLSGTPTASVAAASYTYTATDADGDTASLSFTIAVQPSVSATSMDREVLVALYEATGGPGWTDRTNWLSAEPLELWHGVTTDAAGRVEAVDLTGNGLSGSRRSWGSGCRTARANTAWAGVSEKSGGPGRCSKPTSPGRGGSSRPESAERSMRWSLASDGVSKGRGIAASASISGSRARGAARRTTTATRNTGSGSA